MEAECFSVTLPPSILSGGWEKFTWPTERLQIWVRAQRRCMCVTRIKCILSISFLKIPPVPPVTLPATHQTHAPAIRRLPVIDLNLRGNYFPRDLFVLFCFVFLIFLSDTRGYRSERRRRDGCKTRVWPFTEARRRWSGSRVSDNSSFLPPPPPQTRRPSTVRHQARLHSHTWSHFIMGWTWANIPVDTLSSPEMPFAGEKTTNRPNHFVRFCFFVLFDVWRPHFERPYRVWDGHTLVSPGSWPLRSDHWADGIPDKRWLIRRASEMLKKTINWYVIGCLYWSFANDSCQETEAFLSKAGCFLTQT